MTSGTPKPGTTAVPQAPQAPEYSKGVDPATPQMSALFRLTTVLHGLTDLDAISSALLSTMIASEGLGFDRVALFLLDRQTRRLLGHAAAGERERELTHAFWKLLEGFPETLPEAVRVTTDPRGRLRSPLTKKVRRLSYSLGDVESAPVRAAVSNKPGCSATTGLPDPPDMVLALGEGPWSYWPLVGVHGVVGVLGVAGGYAQPFPGAIHELLVLLAHHAGLSIERGQTYQSLERQLAEMATVQEISRGILSATNLEDLLGLISRVSSRVMQARWAATWLTHGPEENLRLASHCGLPSPEAEFRTTLQPLADRCAGSRRPLRMADAVTEGHLPSLPSGQARSVLFVPLIAFDRTLGVLGVGDREPLGEMDAPVFQEEDEQFLTFLGAQAAVAIKNAHLFDQVRETEKRLRETQGLLLQTEKMAALGEMSAKVAHEIRNPLSAVGGFARRIERGLPKGDPNSEYASLIVRETERLEGILTEQLEFARLGRPRLQKVSLTEVVKETLLLVREEADRKGVKILEEYGRDLPEVLLDRDKVKQVVLNILQNALAAVVRGNRIQLRTGRQDEDLRLEIANDGEPLPGEILDSLFVPFATARSGGCGLGLAVAHQIVKEHGGEIQVCTSEPWSVVFTISFPIRDNQDRRQRVADRRRSRDRRRAA